MAKIGSKHISIDDYNLVVAARDGDQKAFAALYDKYRSALLAFLLKYVSITEDAEDICQRSFEKAFMNINRYNPQYAFSTWLYIIAQNEAIDHIRKARNALKSVSLSGGEADLRDTSATYSPEEIVILKQDMDHFTSRILNLPEKYREVAILRFLRDYAYEEIANELQLTLGAVKTRINRAKKILRETI
ncbi:MAG: sigma-70 family RNA polymerase sigma factor [Bacteroidales bacterium]|jgi:RNA polymerase sigma factor (sigma-70 family)|nr:sigma-70 family RNA polymerase sigma factor [Bacteroidales bacterium]